MKAAAAQKPAEYDRTQQPWTKDQARRVLKFCEISLSIQDRKKLENASETQTAKD